jgi:hypothetical protein
MNAFSTYEYTSLLVQLLLFVVTIGMTIFLTKWTITSQYDVALKSGSLDRPDPCLYFGNHKLSPSSETRIVYGSLFENDSPIIAFLPLELRNEGKKTLKDVSITVRYPQAPNMLLSEVDVKGAGIFSKENPERTTSQRYPFQYASWHTTGVHPNVLLGIAEPFGLVETKPIVRTFREGNQWYRADTEYSLHILITVTAEDVQAQDYVVLLHSIKCSNIEDLECKYHAKVKQRSRHIRESVSYLKFALLYFAQVQKNDIMIYLSKDNKAIQKVISYYPVRF